MRKFTLKTLLLLAIMLTGGGNCAWGTTETLSGADATTIDNGIVKTSFTILGTYNPSGSADINSKSCLKVRWKKRDSSTGNVNGFALRVNPGYKITQVVAQMSGNSTDLVLADIKVDGTSYSGSYSKTLKGSEQSTKYTNITLSDISATEYINFEYSSGGTASQGFVYITVTYEERSRKVKETFDFHTKIAAGYSNAKTSPSQSVTYYLYGNSETATESTSAKLKYIYNSSGAEYTMGDHIYMYAHASNADLSNTNYWWIRTDAGYNVLYNNKTNQNQRFALVGLSKGDKFTITFATGSLAFQTANVYLESDGTKTNVTASSTVDDCTSVQSGETYVVSDDALGEDGSINVAMVTKKANVSISKIIIERPSVTETITAPTINVTYNGANRTVTLIDGETNSLNSGVRTYYTTDGTTPTTNSTRYTAPLDISENCTIKAISVAVNGATSTVQSQEVSVGKLTVAAPTITFSSMESNGDFYSPKYVIANGDNSGILGSPTPELTATYNGEDVDISLGTFTPNASGTLVVKATAMGYLDSEEASESITAVYSRYWQSNDFSTMTASEVESAYPTWANPESTPSRWSNWNVTTWGGFTASDFYLVTSGGSGYKNYTFDSHFQIRNNLAYLIMGYGIARGAGEPLYITGTESGDIVAMKVYTGTGSKTVEAGSEIRYRKYTDSNISLSTNHSNLLVQATIYRPVESVPVTITAAGYATFSSTYPLDFTDANRPAGLTAYRVSGKSGDNITMEPITTTVAANIGLVLKGAADDYDIPVAASGTTYNSESDPVNYLFAISSDYTLNAAGEGTNYVLGLQGGNVVFAPIGANGASVTTGHAALWLPGSFSSKALRIVVDGEATEVTAPEVAETEEPEVLVNLAGIPVGKDFKGIVINQKGEKRFNK